MVQQRQPKESVGMTRNDNKHSADYTYSRHIKSFRRVVRLSAV